MGEYSSLGQVGLVPLRPFALKACKTGETEQQVWSAEKPRRNLKR